MSTPETAHAAGWGHTEVTSGAGSALSMETLKVSIKTIDLDESRMHTLSFSLATNIVKEV